MKRLAILLTAVLFLAACSDEPVAESVESEIEPKETIEAEGVPAEDEPTQEELNAQMREEAIELDFVKINAAEVGWGTKVKGTGKIGTLYPEGLRGGDFTFSVKEGDGYGVYYVANFNTEEIPISEGQTVTIYGTLDGRDKTNVPKIIATIIE